ncbi:MAG TPA: carboxymuconolactone decarboxylase family protein [Gemmatimonadaceae bacterium]|jgi:alkylhydroperoxidase family enzyme|nr:carboxymuconolactone decarboxylase family protein [Gemmatimonadaceae bacterium]
MEHEPRVTRIAADAPEAAPVRETFDAFMRERGKVPNLFRVAAHRPPIMRTLAAHLSAVMGPGEVPVLLKELLSVRVSRINNCEY